MPCLYGFALNSFCPPKVSTGLVVSPVFQHRYPVSSLFLLLLSLCQLDLTPNTMSYHHNQSFIAYLSDRFRGMNHLGGLIITSLIPNINIRKKGRWACDLIQAAVYTVRIIALGMSYCPNHHISVPTMIFGVQSLLIHIKTWGRKA